MGIEKIAAASISDIRQRDKTEDWGYTSLTGGALDYQLNISRADVLKDVNLLYIKNPIAYRIIQSKTRYMIGDGLKIEAEEEEVQKVLDDFFKRNKWGTKMTMRVNDLAVNGEFIILPTVMKNSGKVSIETIYPGLITERKKDSQFADEISAFKVIGSDSNPQEYKIISFNELTNIYEGDVFYYAINKPSHMDYGFSDLFVSRDWLKMYDKSLFATMSRVGMLLSFVWDISIDTTDRKVLEQKLKDLQRNPVVPGSARIHNKNEVWKAESPNLNGSDMDNIFRLLRGQCISAQGIPEFLLGLGGDVNLATASAMLRPFFLDVKDRAQLWEHIFSNQFDYVIKKALLNGMLDATINTKYKAKFPDPDTDKIKDFAESLVKFSNAVVILQTNGLLEFEDARNSVAWVFTMLGFDITENDEMQSSFYNKVVKAFDKYSKGNGTKLIKK